MSAPVKLTIDLDFDKHLSTYRQTGAEDFSAEPRTVEDLIIDHAAHILAARAASEERRDLSNRIRAIRDDEIRALVAPMVATAIDEAVAKTDNYGARVDGPTTLRTVIMTKAVEALTATSRNDRSSFNDRPKSVLDVLISEAVSTAVTKELREALDKGRADVVSALRANAAQVLADTIARQAKS
jgi:hypothetical protein